jgi:hypothetical protein
MRERKPLAAEMVIGSIGDCGDGEASVGPKKRVEKHWNSTMREGKRGNFSQHLDDRG